MIALVLIYAHGSAAIAQFTWDGSCATNNWHTCCSVPGGLIDNNWDLDPTPECPPFPGPNDEVDLNGAAVFLTVQPAQVRNVSNGSLTVTTMGSLLTTEFVNLGSLLINTTLTAGGDIIISGPLRWRGTLAAPAGSDPAAMRVGANGPISIDMLFNAILDRRTLVANGPVSWTGSGDIMLNNGSAFENRVSLNTNRDERIAGNDGLFLNAAPFTKGDSTGLTRVLPNVFFDNTDLGTIDVATGTLSLEVGGQNRGAIRVSDGADIVFAPPTGGFFSIVEDTIVDGGGLVRLAEGSGVFVVSAGRRFGAQNVQLNGPAVVRGGGCEFTNLTFIRGTMADGVTTVNGDCAIFGNIGRTLDGHVLNLRGTTAWDQGSFVDFQIVTGGILNNFGTFTIRNEPNKRLRFVNGQFINHTGGRLDILTDISAIVGPGVIQNLDTINIGPGATLVSFTPVEFEQLGVLNLRSGVLNVHAGRAFEGQFNLSAGTLLQFLNQTFVIEGGTQFSGSGQVFIGGNSILDFQQSSTEMANVELGGIGGGTVTGPGDLVVTDQLDWTRGQMTGSGATITRATLNMTGTNAKTISQRSLRHEGTGAWTGGNFTLNNGARFVVASGATFDVQSPGNFTHASGADGVVEVIGTLRKTSATTLTFPAGVQFINRGSKTFDIQSGDVVLSGGGENSGTISIPVGSNLRFLSSYTLNGGSIEGVGLASVEGGVLGIEGTPQVQNLDLAGGSIDGSGNLTVNELLTWTNGIIGGFGNGTVTIAPGAEIDMSLGGQEKRIEVYTLSNEGTGLISDNRVLLLDGATWNNAGTLELQDGASVNPSALGSASLVNSGMIEKTGAPQSFIRVPFTHSGAVRVESNALYIGGGGSSTGTFHAEANTAVIFPAGQFALNAGTRFTGPGNADVLGATVIVNADVNAARFRVTSGTLTGPGALDVADSFTWTGGTLSGNGSTIVRQTGFLDGIQDRTLDQRRLLNFGTMDWEGPLAAFNGGRIVNVGTFRMGVLFSRNSSFTGADGGVFQNESTGVMVKAGPDTYVLDVVVDNSGRIVVADGVLRFAHTYNQTAGSVVVQAGQILSGRVEFDHPVNLQGGTIGGNGTALVQGLRNVGGVVKPGDSPGVFTLEGDYEQAPGGTLEIELGGLTPDSEHDVFVVTGTATLGGVLRVMPINGFIPQVGDEFVILSAVAIEGTFDAVSGPGQFEVIYGSTSVTLRVIEAPACSDLSPADVNFDCHVSLPDHAILSTCLAGPAATSPPPGCTVGQFQASDVAFTGTVDLRDFAALQLQFLFDSIGP